LIGSECCCIVTEDSADSGCRQARSAVGQSSCDRVQVRGGSGRSGEDLSFLSDVLQLRCWLGRWAASRGRGKEGGSRGIACNFAVSLLLCEAFLRAGDGFAGGAGQTAVFHMRISGKVWLYSWFVISGKWARKEMGLD
jgi:hypothetical protein